MTDGEWRPLGVDTEDEVAEYDALHDGVPPWMRTAFWAWIQRALVVVRFTQPRGYDQLRYKVAMVEEDLAEQMCQRLRIPLSNIRTGEVADYEGQEQFETVLGALGNHPHPLQIADYLLAEGRGDAKALDGLLQRSKSAWRVGERSSRPGLVRRVAEGVQMSVDDVMARAGQAGVRLAKAWGELYGLNPDPSHAYNLAIKAVEDAAIPRVSPTSKSATLGTVIAQMEQQGNWKLPLDREHTKAPSGETLIAMMRMLWHGQYDRHGGQPLVAGDVSFEEAQVAVGLAVTLVSWFDASLPARSTT